MAGTGYYWPAPGISTTWCSHPILSVAYIEDKQDAYDVNGNGGTVAVDGQTISVGRLSIAQEIGYRYELESASLLPYLRAGLHWDFDQAETFVLLDDRVALDELRGSGEPESASSRQRRQRQSRRGL